LIRKGKEKVEEGGDRLDLMCFVQVASTVLGSEKEQEKVDVKGKGKEKAKEPTTEEDGVEAAGRLLWAFAVIRGGDSESNKSILDELDYDGLECESLRSLLYDPPADTHPLVSSRYCFRGIRSSNAISCALPTVVNLESEFDPSRLFPPLPLGAELPIRTRSLGQLPLDLRSPPYSPCRSPQDLSCGRRRNPHRRDHLFSRTRTMSETAWQITRPSSSRVKFPFVLPFFRLERISVFPTKTLAPLIERLDVPNDPTTIYNIRSDSD
jgi:hypothetical protein